MSTLVIEWDRDHLIIVAGTPSGSGVTLQRALTLQPSTRSDPEECGWELRHALSSAGIKEESVSVVLPRSSVTLRRIQLPAVTDDELPDMVRLQAATRLTVPVDSVCMDFVPLPPLGEGRDVLLATAPNEQITRIRRTVQAAGLQLTSVHVSSFGIATALARSGVTDATDSSVEAVISLRAEMIELLMIRQQSVVFSHSGASWASADQIEQAVRSEISRGRMAATEDIGTHTVRQVTLVGAENVTSAVPDAIASRLDHAEIRRLDPAASIVQGPLPDELSASDVLAAAGVIAARPKDRQSTVDLINPRQAEERPDNRRLKIILTVGAVLLLSTAAWKWRDSTIAGINSRTRQIESEVSQLTRAYKDGEDDLDKDAAIRQWSLSNVDWLDEMDRIRTIMGGTDRLLIREFTCSAGQGAIRGTITAECYARERRDVEEFYRRLEQAGYDVVPRAIESGSRDPDYAAEFSLVLNLPVPEEDS